MFQLVEPREAHARAHARQPFTHQHDIRADVVFRHHVRQPPPVDVEPRAVAFEPHEATEHEARQPVARRMGKGRGRVEHAADLGRVNPEQPHAPDHGHVNRVAVEHGTHEHEFRSVKRPQRKHGNGCNERGDGTEQKLHRDLLCQTVTRSRSPDCKSITRTLLTARRDDGIVVQ
jgi:hypothetical protein